MLEHFSVSQVTTFLGCSRRYAFRYVEKAPKERRSLALVFGSAVHGAVGWLLEQRMMGEFPSAIDAAERLDADWSAAMDEGLVEEPMEKVRAQLEVARQLVHAYAEAEPNWVPDDVEARMVVDVQDPRTLGMLPVPLLGYADAVEGSVVMELKTTARKGSPWRWRLQLAAYSMAFRQLRGVRPLTRVVQLVKGKVPTVVVDEVTVVEADEIRFAEIASEVLSAVQAGAFVTNPTWACKTCEYRKRCGAA